jgi:hypothetical protein
VNLWIPGIFYGFAVTVKRMPVFSNWVICLHVPGALFSILLFFNFSKKKYYIVYIREIPWNFRRYQKNESG